ncbi:MAG: FAD:protein FMN transferase [Opitutus sp.]|nr:FAD:protein FMN transferase [Opitutus sp.]
MPDGYAAEFCARPRPDRSVFAPRWRGVIFVDRGRRPELAVSVAHRVDERRDVRMSISDSAQVAASVSEWKVAASASEWKVAALTRRNSVEPVLPLGNGYQLVGRALRARLSLRQSNLPRAERAAHLRTEFPRFRPGSTRSRSQLRSGLVCGLVLVGASSVSTAGPVALTGYAMGTTWSVKFIQPSVPLDLDMVTRRVADRLERLEQIFSTYRPNSELSRFNAAPGTDWFPVSPELAWVAIESRRISELTDGAFDVTVDPLVRLWGFGPTGRVVPPPAAAEIAAVRSRVGWRNLEARLESPAIRRTQIGVTADFSSIAKGFASDAIGGELAGVGAVDHFVQVGGDVKTAGAGAEGASWRAGIEEPTDDARAIACVVHLNGRALSTSGDYRNFVIERGRRYGHIIDPRTGQPAGGGLASVSVVHTSCAVSSALATALYVLGFAEGLARAQEQKLACVFFVRRKEGFERRMTPEFEALLR